jgi:F-type H+-transporting ATPase subunit gamma
VANLKDIRRRIAGVQSTQQITRAMKLVAAAKLRRAQERIESQRPYALQLRSMIAALAERADETAHPLLRRRELRNVELLVLTSDRGLCGSFNINICRTTEAYVREHRDVHEQAGLVIVGRKGNEYFKRRPAYTIQKYYREILTNPEFGNVSEIGRDITARYTDRDLDGVFMVYNEFKSAASQKVVIDQLLPIDTSDVEHTSSQIDYLYEPDRSAILERILPLHVNIQIWRAVLESLASEMGSRMTAMDAATKNAGELLAALTLQYNRARQEAITNELMDIVGGAEALRG